MSQSKQLGGAPLIGIIAVLVVVIIGVLGWLFWSNFINKPQTNANIANFEDCKKATGSKVLETFPEQCVTSDGRTFVGPGEKSTTEAKLLTYCTKAEELCFDYPSSWTTKIEQINGTIDDPGHEGEVITLTSSDKELVLRLETGIGGIGGTCDDETAGTIKLLTPIPITGLSGYADDYNNDKPIVARYVGADVDGKFAATFFASTAKSLDQTGTVNACNASVAEFIKGKHAKLSNDYEGYGSFRFTSDQFDSHPTYGSAADAEAAFASTNYKQAVAIIASLRY